MKGQWFARKKSLWAMLFIIAIAPLLSGCIFAEHAPLEISLAPKVPTVPINIGGGTIIYLSVLDQRTERTLGYRGMVTRWHGMTRPLGHELSGAISTSENVEGLIQNSLKGGFTSLGFDIITAPEQSALKLEVSVQNLNHWVLRNPTGADGARFNGTITGKLYRGDTLLYESSYHHTSRDHSYSIIRGADRSWLEENFNAAISNLMGQLLADLELLRALR